jgi:hypothetical protein
MTSTPRQIELVDLAHQQSSNNLHPTIYGGTHHYGQLRQPHMMYPPLWSA